MTPVGGLPIPSVPDTFNLLARPYKTEPTCRICGFPGHQSASIHEPQACRTAILMTLSFWEEMAPHISNLYAQHQAFRSAINKNAPTYAMRLDDCPLKGTGFEEIVVDRLTRNYLKFQAHLRGIKAKMMVILEEKDKRRLEKVTFMLDDFLLKGSSRKCALWVLKFVPFLVMCHILCVFLMFSSVGAFRKEP
jgi:CCR4-NOT transcription complex subunit 2